MTCDHAYDDGAYVLGALSPAERAAYERHLAGCAACREAVAEIAVLPGLLGRLDRAGLETIVPPWDAGSRLPELMAAAQAARRRERRATRLRYAGTALAAACLALLAGLGVLWLRGGTVPPSGTGIGTGTGARMAVMKPVRGGIPVHAEVGYRVTAWGTEITMRCGYEASGKHVKAYTFRLVAHGPDGTTEQVGSWVAAPGDDVTITGTTRFSGADLVRLELTRNDGSPLLAYDLS